MYIFVEYSSVELKIYFRMQINFTNHFSRVICMIRPIFKVSDVSVNAVECLWNTKTYLFNVE